MGPKAIAASVLFGLFLIVGAVYGFASCVNIPPGHVGVLIRKCDGGGVDKTPLTTGYHHKSVFCEEIDEYPTNLQTIVLTKSTKEGSENDDSITVTSHEGLPINVDVSMSFTLEAAKVPAIYEKYRSDITKIAHTYVRQTLREGLQLTFAKYTAEELYSDKKEVARAEVQQYLVSRLKDEGFDISQFTINETRVPHQVTEAINAKVAMTQEAQKAEAEVRKTRALAEQRKAQAEGEAAAMRLKADAEAYFNLTVAKSITPEFVQYKALEKWSGTLPSVTAGNNAVPFINLSNATK